MSRLNKLIAGSVFCVATMISLGAYGQNCWYQTTNVPCALTYYGYGRNCQLTPPGSTKPAVAQVTSKGQSVGYVSTTNGDGNCEYDCNGGIYPVNYQGTVIDTTSKGCNYQSGSGGRRTDFRKNAENGYFYGLIIYVCI